MQKCLDVEARSTADHIGNAFVVSVGNLGRLLLKLTMHCNMLSKPCPEQGNLTINLTASASAQVHQALSVEPDWQGAPCS